ncbi:MAG TPA: hypothetical protein VLV18_08860, partial [Terriglobales bacterium]|nr:hypothetical protein [Terriglobales bacterium]
MSRLSAPRMVLLVYALIALTVIIPVYGSNPARAVCRVQIVGSNYPSNPYPNQTISITTHLVLTCTSTGDNVIAEVDIHPYGSHNFLSTNSYFIGPIQLTTPPYNATLDVTVSNTVKTPT